MLPTLEQLASIAEIVFDPKQPIAVICHLIYAFLLDSENDTILPIIDTVWRNAVNSFKYALRPLYRSFVRHKSLHLQKITVRGGSEKGLADLRKSVKLYDKNCRSREDVRHLDARLALVNGLPNEACKQYQEAANVAIEIIESTRKFGFPAHWVADYRGWGHWHPGYAQMRLQNFEAGDFHLREAVRLRVAAFGTQDTLALKYQADYEWWLRKLGRAATADVVGKLWSAEMGLESICATNDETNDW